MVYQDAVARSAPTSCHLWTLSHTSSRRQFDFGAVYREEVSKENSRCCQPDIYLRLGTARADRVSYDRRVVFPAGRQVSLVGLVAHVEELKFKFEIIKGA